MRTRLRMRLFPLVREMYRIEYIAAIYSIYSCYKVYEHTNRIESRFILYRLLSINSMNCRQGAWLLRNRCAAGATPSYGLYRALVELCIEP